MPLGTYVGRITLSCWSDAAADLEEREEVVLLPRWERLRKDGNEKQVNCGRNLGNVLAPDEVDLREDGEVERRRRFFRKIGPMIGRQAQITPTTTSIADQVKTFTRPPFMRLLAI